MADPTTILGSTVLAAVVSGAALWVREWLSRRSERRGEAARLSLAAQEQRIEAAIRQSQLLLQQVQLLWAENAALKQRERECDERYRALEERFRLLERRCERLQRRIEQLDPA